MQVLKEKFSHSQCCQRIKLSYLHSATLLTICRPWLTSVCIQPCQNAALGLILSCGRASHHAIACKLVQIRFSIIFFLIWHVCVPAGDDDASPVERLSAQQHKKRAHDAREALKQRAGDSMTVTRKPRPCTSNFSMSGLLFIL